MRTTAYLLLLATGLSCSQPEEPTLFREVAAEAGLDFANRLEENNEQNIIDYLYFYNGAGVAVADFDNNGFEDIYLVRNQGANALYLNQGNWSFTEVAQQAGVEGKADFQNGVSVVDLNADGYPDLHVSAVEYHTWSGHNEFYLNNGDGTFRETSAQLGIDLRGYGQQALFFDCDNDGDQDLYVLRHSVHPSGAFNKASQRSTSDTKAGDMFFLNVGSPEAPKFEERTEAFGVLSSQIGYGLGIVAEDFNNDSYLDLYIANDFHENDYLYLNDGGTGFTLTTHESFQTNSKFTMGVDAADINADGRADLFTLDMKPWDEVERKNALGAEPFHIHKYKRTQGYVEQFPKNSVFFNRGSVGKGDQEVPVFEDRAPLLGMESTDWSWGVLLRDFDGDGRQDVFVTNGIKRRPNDLDYIQFLSDGGGVALSDEGIYSSMPSGQTPNRAFQGTSDGPFNEVSRDWGLDYVGTSNGSAVADFDNDGRWDLVVNNLDGPALLYKNELGEPATLVDFGGYNVRYRKRIQARNHWNLGTRSWLSHSSTKVAVDDFGGAVIVEWPHQSAEAFTLLPGEHNALRPGQGSSLKDQALATMNRNQPSVPLDTLPFAHKEDSYTSFVQTPLLLEGVDEMGPAAATWGEFAFLGGSTGKSPLWINMVSRDTSVLWSDRAHEDTDAGLIQLGNGDEALVVVTGSSQQPNRALAQQDRMYTSPGGSSTTLGHGSNASCLAVLDINGDGIQDLFVGERAVWNDYGAAPQHVVYFGNVEGGLERATPESVPWTQELGMVTDASVADLNLDGTPELILTTDWGPVFQITCSDPIQIREIAPPGLWRSVYTSDINGDGTPDLLLGGLGQNHGIAVGQNKPIELYIKDLDNNGNRDFLYSYINQGEKFPLFGRDELIKESVQFRKTYLKNRTYAGQSFASMFADQLDGAQQLSVQFTGSAALLSADSTHILVPLPDAAQTGPIYAATSTTQGVLIAGGSDAMHTSIGTQESFCGGYITAQDTTLHFQPTPFIVRGSTVSLLKSPTGIWFVQNNGPVLELTAEN